VTTVTAGARRRWTARRAAIWAVAAVLALAAAYGVWQVLYVLTRQNTVV
jgi:hypothetical protein